MTVSVSVIIPTYNSASLVTKAIDSVLGQSYTNFQIIVVDDGSTDNTSDCLAAYSDSITLIPQVNGGASKARNAGIECATGEFIAFLDADDEWHPKKLEIQVNALRNHTDWLACYSEFSTQVVDVSLGSEPVTFTSKNLQEFFLSPYCATSSLIVRRPTLQKVGFFDAELTTAEDVDLCLRIAECGVIGEIDKCLVLRGDVEGSLGDLPNSYQDNLVVVDRFISRQSDHKVEWERLARQVKAKVLADWGKDLIWRSKPKEAIGVCVRSLALKFRLSTCFILLKALIKSL
ncbi:glycosyltransferase family 2 protein [Agarivorans aestuarii]|uniref:glycosyltransferase family 2 protein n=1 Tax=Agarivorans aestuarii TaxID=1563703 RepID=UPI001C80454A|nr:glycosyltransferase family A protein [Agarivorans aestuarii]